MHRGAKFSLITGGVIGTLVVAAFIFISTFNINDYRQRIALEVRDATGRDLDFDSELQLSFFPTLGIELGKVSVSNARGFGTTPMLSVNSARLGVKFWPLFLKQIRFGTLELDGFTLHLSRRADNTTNWDDLFAHHKSSDEEENDADGGFSLEIEGVDLKHGTLSIDDDTSNAHFSLNDIHLNTGQILRGIPFTFKGGLAFECTTPKAQGTISFQGSSAIDIMKKQYRANNMGLNVLATGDGVPGGQGSVAVQVQSLELDFSHGLGKLSGVDIQSYGMVAHVDGSFQGLTKGVKKVKGTVSVDTFDARAMLASLGLDRPEMADENAMTRVEGMAEIVATPNELDISKFQARLDDTNVSGTVTLVNDLNGPACTAKIVVDTLDCDRYLSPALGESRDTPSSSQQASVERRILDAKAIRRITSSIEATIAKLRVNGMWVDTIYFHAKSADGRVDITPIKAGLYDGTVSAAVSMNATTDVPKVDLIIGLDKVDIGKLSQDTLGHASHQGLLHLNGVASSQGETVHSLLGRMNGKISFHLSDGVFPGVNLSSLAQEAHANKDEKGKTVEGRASQSTKFGSITGTGVISDGVLKNRDLEIKAPGLRADGAGVIGLNSHKLDYLLKVKLVPTGEGQGGGSYDSLYGVLVPIRVAGTIENPHYWVSITEYMKVLGGAVLSLPVSILGGVKDIITGVGRAVSGKSFDTDEKSEEK